MLKKTKIVCTMGPSTEKKGVLDALLANGMNCARFNFSHGSHEEHKARINQGRAAAKQADKVVSLSRDTKGPEMRLGEFKDGKVQLEKGKRFVLTYKDTPGDETHVSVNHKKLWQEVKPGDTLLLSDGLVGLKVEKIEGKDIVTKILNSGQMSTRKRVAAPGVALGLPPISEQDEKDIIFGIKSDMDFVAASFIQRVEDVHAIRELIQKHGGHMEIIPKIENLAGVKNFDEILEAADGIMVARGDLGVEVPAEDVPLIQKEIIEKCNKAGKPVIVATQMLESMTSNPRPTRAEVADVANAILDGTDAIMLSGETAGGDYPVEAVQTMNRIALRIEKSLKYKSLFEERGIMRRATTEAIAHATVQVGYEINAKAIITPTESGYTTRRVFPMLTKKRWKNTTEILETAADIAKGYGLVKPGDIAVITSGIKNVAGKTSTMRVYTID